MYGLIKTVSKIHSISNHQRWAPHYHEKYIDKSNGKRYSLVYFDLLIIYIGAFGNVNDLAPNLKHTQIPNESKIIGGRNSLNLDSFMETG